MRAKFIYEKFKEESDPIRDMGIGIYHPVKYKSYNKAAHFVINHLTTIMGVYEIPNNIVNKPTEPNEINVFNKEYWAPVKQFLKDNVLTIDGRRDMQFLGKVLSVMFKLLHDKGYPKNVNEAFTEESDPIKDMGIGMLQQIKKYLKDKGKKTDIVHNRTNALFALDLFRDECKYEYCKFLIENSTLFNINQDDLITALQIATIHQNWKFGKLLMNNGVNVDVAIIDAKNRDMGTTVTRLELLRDNFDTISIDEAFTEDSDPIRDMGIGDPLRHIAIRSDIGRRQIYVLLGLKEDGYWMKIYDAGTVGWNYDRSREYASFIHNRKNIIMMVKSVREYPDSYRKPTEHELELIRKATRNAEDQKYLNDITEKTGIDLRV